MKNQVEILLCSRCLRNLINKDNKAICSQCNHEEGYINDGIIIFNDISDKESFFEKQAVNCLRRMYSDFSYDKFKKSLLTLELDQMDVLNKKVGITRKKWWEDYIGEIRNSSILEIGCGVNYIVPYWLDSGNEVVAFDVCKESIFLLRDILKKINIDTQNLMLFVGDARRINIAKKFDVININNVLHHIDDKRNALLKIKELLKDDGKILIVEPNYYYPPRWIIETNFLDSINFIKPYFVKNDLIERGERGIIFKELKKIINELGLKIEVNKKDFNYLGYFTYILHNNSLVSKLIYNFDRYFLSRLLPERLAPFEYLILRK